MDASPLFTDPDGDPLSYRARSSDGLVATAEVSGSTVELFGITPGTVEVTLTAQDPGGLEASSGFGVTVVQANQAPVALGKVPALAVAAGEAATVDASPLFIDPDGDALSYRIRSSDPSVASAESSGGTIVVLGVAVGTASVTVTARDPDGLEAVQRFAVTVPNRAPVAADSIPAQTVNVGDTLELAMSAYFSDHDNEILAYEASSSDDAKAAASVSGDEVSIEGKEGGTVFVTVTATDPGDSAVTQSINVTVVQPNRAPSASGSVPAQTVHVGDTLELVVSAYFSDPDKDDLAYTASSSDSAKAIPGVSGDTVSVEGKGVGSATVTVTAEDPGGETATQSFDVTVPNRAPVAQSIPAQAVDVDDTLGVDMSAYFSDPDNQSLAYEASSSDTAKAAVSVSGDTVSVIGVVLTTNQEITVTVTATDPGDSATTQTFRVTVTPPNRAPSVRRGLGTLSHFVVGSTALYSLTTNFSATSTATL